VAKVGTVRILYSAGTISLQAAMHPKYTLGALNMKEEEEEEEGLTAHMPRSTWCIVRRLRFST